MYSSVLKQKPRALIESESSLIFMWDVRPRAPIPLNVNTYFDDVRAARAEGDTRSGTADRCPAKTCCSSQGLQVFVHRGGGRDGGVLDRGPARRHPPPQGRETSSPKAEEVNASAQPDMGTSAPTVPVNPLIVVADSSTPTPSIA